MLTEFQQSWIDKKRDDGKKKSSNIVAALVGNLFRILVIAGLFYQVFHPEMDVRVQNLVILGTWIILILSTILLLFLMLGLFCLWAIASGEEETQYKIAKSLVTYADKRTPLWLKAWLWLSSLAIVSGLAMMGSLFMAVAYFSVFILVIGTSYCLTEGYNKLVSEVVNEENVELYDE